MTDVGTQIPLPSRPSERPMSLSVRYGCPTVPPNAPLLTAGAHIPEADPAQAVASDPSVIDAERDPLYRDGVQHREEVCAVWCDERNCGCIGEKPPTHSEYVRQGRLSRWQEQR